MTPPATTPHPPHKSAARLTHVRGDEAIPGVSQAVIVEHGRTAYVSGQVPFTAAGDIPLDLETQLAQVFTNLDTALHNLGSTAADLARITIYVVGLTEEKLPLIRTARDQFLRDTDSPPASALLGVAALFHPDALVEVDAIVSLPNLP